MCACATSHLALFRPFPESHFVTMNPSRFHPSAPEASAPILPRSTGPSSFGRSLSRRRALLGGLAAAAVASSGCASVDPKTYAAERPLLDLQTYFNGTVDAWGVFQDRSGKVVRRFTVVMRCSWAGDVGTLDEDFTYSDGTTEKRIWTLRKLPDGRYSGTAGDVVGQADGQVSGNAFNWRYTLALKVDGRTWNVDFDDWMYLIDDRVMLNRATMSKFGVRLGEVLLSFTRR